MRALLDTHALLWWLSDDRALSKEIATKVRLGKLPTGADLAADFLGCLEQEGFELLAISAEHAMRVGLLAGAGGRGDDRVRWLRVAAEAV